MKYYRMKLGIMKDEQGNRYKPTLKVGEKEEEKEIPIEYIMRDEDKALIPCNEANADYVAFLNDKDKAVEDFDYEKEKARQLKAAEEKETDYAEPDEERIKAREE